MPCRLTGPVAAVILLASAHAAGAQTVACQARASGADWQTALTVMYAAGAEQISSLKAEARGEGQGLSEETSYGWNVLAESREPLSGWIGVIRHRAGAQPPRAQVDVAAPQMFDFDAIMLGKGDGTVPLFLRVVADGSAAAVRPAPLVGPAGPWPTSAAGYQKVRVGDAKAVAGDNAEAMALADRLARARRVKVEVVDAKERTVGVMALRDGVLTEAFAAEPGLRQRVAADLAAGRCRKM